MLSRHDDVRSEIVVVLQRTVKISTGRRAFVEVGGIATLLRIIKSLQETGAAKCEGFYTQCFGVSVLAFLAVSAQERFFVILFVKITCLAHAHH